MERATLVFNSFHTPHHARDRITLPHDLTLSHCYSFSFPLIIGDQTSDVSVALHTPRSSSRYSPHTNNQQHRHHQHRHRHRHHHYSNNNTTLAPDHITDTYHTHTPPRPPGYTLRHAMGTPGAGLQGLPIDYLEVSRVCHQGLAPQRVPWCMRWCLLGATTSRSRIIRTAKCCSPPSIVDLAGFMR